VERTKVVPSTVVYDLAPYFTLAVGTVVQAPVAVDVFKADFESQTQSASSSRPVNVKVVAPVGQAVHGRDGETALAVVASAAFHESAAQITQLLVSAAA